MKLDELALFAQVVESGGMSQAAAALGLSQPNVSRTIRGLEQRLNATLFNRTGRGVELTASGQRFLGFAQETLENFQHAKTAIAELDGAIPSELVICIPRHTGRLLVPAIFRTFQERLPGVTLEIKERQAIDTSKALMDKSCDVAVFYDNATSPFPERRKLFCEPLYITGHPRHLGTSDAPISLAACAELPLLMFSNPPYARMVERAFTNAGLTPNVIRRLENKIAMVAFAMEGEGVAVQAFSNFVNEYENGEIRARLIVDPGIHRNILAAVGLHVERRFANTVFRLLKTSLDEIATSARWQPVQTNTE